MTDRPTVDFDHHDPAWHADRVERWRELRACPVAFNERYGGFWVISGHEEVAAVSRDAATFSSRHLPEPEDGVRWLGIAGIPRGKAIPTSGIAEVEEEPPPVWRLRPLPRPSRAARRPRKRP